MIGWMLDGPGEPDAFRKVTLPDPEVKPGWLRIEVDAFGLNRSELFSRRGMSSSDFSYPRILGLECVGRIADPSDSGLAVGQRVMCMMGGMGRSFHGGYATHVLVPRSQVFPVDTALSAQDFGALPETWNTAWGVCIENLALTGEDVVLVRGGTSALGMASIEIAKDLGAKVAATSRSPEKAQLLAERSRADWVLVDGPDFVDEVRRTCGPMTAVVECVGKVTLESSAATMTHGGRLGMVGQLSESWDSDVVPHIPDHVTSDFTRSDLVEAPRDEARMAEIVRRVDIGRYRTNIHRVFSFDELPEAHRVMGANEAVGKLVVLTR